MRSPQLAGNQRPMNGMVPVGPAELEAHQQSERAADEQEDQAGEQELNADDLVIFGEDVLAQEAQLGVSVSAVGSAGE